MKKLITLVLSLLLVLPLAGTVTAEDFDVTQHVNPFTGSAYTESSFYGNGTIIIILSHEASIHWREYTVEDFPELELESVNTLKPSSTDQEYKESNSEYRDFVHITLKDKSNKAVIEAINLLYGNSLVYQAVPMWKTYYDALKPIPDILPDPEEMKGSGDVNGDRSIDLCDVTLLLKHIAGWEMKSTFFSTYYGDINKDSVINLSDAALLLQRIAGWDEDWYMNAINEMINTQNGGTS